MQFTAQAPVPVSVYKGGFIAKPGYYMGTINQAYDYTKPGGTAANIVLDFESNEGQSKLICINTTYVDKKTRETVQNKSNVEFIQEQLLPLLKIRSLEPKKGTISVYNKATQANETVSATVYPQIAGKNIGVWFKGSIDPNQINTKTGLPFVNYNMEAVFDYNTGKTAHELFNKLPADTLELFKEALAEERHVAKQAEVAPRTQTHVPQATQEFGDDFDDDISF